MFSTITGTKDSEFSKLNSGDRLGLLPLQVIENSMQITLKRKQKQKQKVEFIRRTGPRKTMKAFEVQFQSMHWLRVGHLSCLLCVPAVFLLLVTGCMQMIQKYTLSF